MGFALIALLCIIGGFFLLLVLIMAFLLGAIKILTQKASFQIKIDATSEICLEAYEGQILVQIPELQLKINKPQQICFSEDGQLLQQVYLPTTPELLLPVNLHRFLFNPDEDSQVELVWKKPTFA